MKEGDHSTTPEWNGMGGNSPGKWVSVCDHFYGMFSCLGLGVQGGMGNRTVRALRSARRNGNGTVLSLSFACGNWVCKF